MSVSETLLKQSRITLACDNSSICVIVVLTSWFYPVYLSVSVCLSVYLLYCAFQCIDLIMIDLSEPWIKLRNVALQEITTNINVLTAGLINALLTQRGI